MSGAGYAGVRDARGKENRAIGWAILASLALHAMLLSSLPSWRRSPPPEAAAAPLLARLVEPAVRAPSVAATAAPAVPKREEPVPEVQKPSAPKPPSRIAKTEPKKTEPKREPSATTVAPPAASPAPAAPPIRGTPQSAPSAPAASAQSEARVAPQPAPSAEATDAGSLAQYRLQLISMARRYKRYPRIAMDNNWEGSAEVVMVIAPNGMISSVGIRTSTGHEVLDQQAVEMFKRAKPLVQIPPALRGKEFSVVLKAIYSLKEPDA